MIVPMKKATILVQAKDADQAVRDLRKFGVLHVEQQPQLQSKNISVLQEELVLINSSLDVLTQAGVLKKINRGLRVISPDWKTAARHIIELHKRYDQLETYLRGVINQINEWQSWGDFDHHQIEHLSQKGVYLKLYQVPLKQIKDFPQDAVVKNIFTVGGIAHCAVFSRRQFDCALKEISPPKQSLSLLKRRFEEDKKAMEAIKKEITKYSYMEGELIDAKNNLEKEIEFQQVLSGMGQEGKIAYVAGYIPFDIQQSLINEAKNRKWGILIDEPSQEDIVPTLIRNPRWVSLINPVFKLLEIIPGYSEIDSSPVFLIFFSIFFGILIGDAGYAMAYALLAFLFQRKLRKPEYNNMFSLFYVLSFCAFVWGMLTGVCFGQEWLINAGFKPLLPELNDVKIMQAFCFFLGALHLTIAHFWRAVRKAPSPAALADVGWICILWCAFFLAKVLILGDTYPFFWKWLFITGLFLVIFFTNPQKNILKTFGEGLGTVALSLMNNFTDVVSYIRLFAVGLAGISIADAFNAMAASIGFGGIFASIGSVIVVIIGHGLCLVLGPMSVLVHGVRLNVLEFAGHANIFWSGTAYKPLKE